MVAEGGRARARRGRQRPSLQAYVNFFSPCSALLRGTQGGREGGSWGGFGELAAPLRRAALFFHTRFVVYCSAACAGTFRVSTIVNRPWRGDYFVCASAWRAVRCGYAFLLGRPSLDSRVSSPRAANDEFGPPTGAPLCLTPKMLMENALAGPHKQKKKVTKKLICEF